MKFLHVLIISFVGIAIIPGMLGLLALFELSIIEESTQEIPKNIEAISLSSELDNHAQLIRYYDEVLTQSARNYAFTQDSFWKERYFSFEPKLENEIRHAIEDGDTNFERIFQSVNITNEKLISFEYEAIKLVDEGKPQVAINLLESDAYALNKGIYQNALEEYIE